MDSPQKLLIRLSKDETWRALGARFDLPASYLHDVAHGKRPASEKLLASLGLERVTVYRRTKNGTSAQSAA